MGNIKSLDLRFKRFLSDISPISFEVKKEMTNQRMSKKKMTN